jgi:hypothetical protein
MRFEFDNTRTYDVAETVHMAESCGLSLCPRCAVAFTSGGLCAACEEIARITMKRINVGIDTNYARRKRHRAYAEIALIAFWTAFGVLVAFWMSHHH